MFKPHLTVAMAVLLAAWMAPGSPGHAQEHPTARPEGKPAGNADHGRYIAEHVAMCVECHSGRDESGNIVDSQRFLGAPIPSLNASWPHDWAIRAPRNRGLPGYTDDEALRLLTQGGIRRDGSQVKPPMPRFRMTPQDAADVIAFLRSLP